MIDSGKIYKIPDGKPENRLVFSGELRNKRHAMGIIHECHGAWQSLISGGIPATTANYEISITNLTIENSPGLVQKIDPEYINLTPDSRQPPAPINPSIDKSFYIASVQL
ncbi:hypothetical protein Clacol_008051 [Clathrus columnatus]|uniref:Uncharacterized protein n=1 Tax=Clathrus columnatus TaxID=1419009 RepID=A0AAV5AM54_9AGAM|nr:hypothetical protein Clacol_008051 [Clathrus columnatus]